MTNFFDNNLFNFPIKMFHILPFTQEILLNSSNHYNTDLYIRRYDHKIIYAFPQNNIINFQ